MLRSVAHRAAVRRTRWLQGRIPSRLEAVFDWVV
jgi:hypothetical protein